MLTREPELPTYLFHARLPGNKILSRLSTHGQTYNEGPWNGCITKQLRGNNNLHKKGSQDISNVPYINKDLRIPKTSHILHGKPPEWTEK